MENTLGKHGWSENGCILWFSKQFMIKEVGPVQFSSGAEPIIWKIQLELKNRAESVSVHAEF